MGAVIEGVGTAIPKPALKRAGSVDLAVRAANKSILRGRSSASNVGLLIFSGVYREEFIGEPALASFIQRRIKANQMAVGTSSTFSMDINDGGRGLITGIEIISGFIRTGDIDQGLAVTADVNPIPRQTVNYPYDPGAASVLLGRGKKGEGFLSFFTGSFPEFLDRYKGEVSYMPNPKGSFLRRKRMGNVLVVEQSRDFLDSSVKCMGKTLDEFMDKIGKKPKDIDLVISSQYPVGIPGRIEKALGFRKGTVIGLPKHYGVHHTSGAGFALRIARRKGIFDRSRDILFMGVGGGITVSMAYYRNGG